MAQFTRADLIRIREMAAKGPYAGPSNPQVEAHIVQVVDQMLAERACSHTPAEHLKYTKADLELQLERLRVKPLKTDSKEFTWALIAMFAIAIIGCIVLAFKNSA